MRRAPAHPLAPVLASVLVAVAYLIASPATADMAAHTFRSGLFAREGLTVWNAQWYGGHHWLGYSLLFSPVAAPLGPRLAGVLAGVVAVALFGAVARGATKDRRAATLATWLFAGAAMSNVVIGRMPFTLGIALAVAAWLCASRVAGRHRLARLAAAALLALAATWASPVAGAFLALTASAHGLGGRRRHIAPAAALALPVLLGGLALVAFFPEGGDDRFAASAFWPMLAVSAAAIALLDTRRRMVAAGAGLYLLMLIGAFVVPTPFGQNALRLGVLLGPPLLILAGRARTPRAAVAAVLVALVYLQWLPAVRAVAEARRDPSTHAAFQAEAKQVLAPRVRPGERVEVPLTLNHWEAALLAPTLPLARGWERQLDARMNPVFYDGRPLTQARYHRWLRDRGIRWVALPAAPLDYSALEERALLERGLPYLEPVHVSPRWRIWRVDGVRPPADGPGRVTAEEPDGFTLAARRPGVSVVRQRWTRYWTVVRGDGCLERAGGWTAVRARSRGPIVVRARFSAGRALGRAPRCGRLPGG